MDKVSLGSSTPVVTKSRRAWREPLLLSTWAVSSLLASAVLVETHLNVSFIYTLLNNYFETGTPFEASIFEFTAYIIVSSVSIITSIVLLRKHDPDHVYVLWYLFFLFTYCGLGIYLYLDTNKLIEVTPYGQLRLVDQTTMLGKALAWYLYVSVDLTGELRLLFILMSAVVVPQLLSFLVSGLAGCGISPILVSRVTQFSILSFVKFCCVFAGLQLSEYLYRAYTYPGALHWDGPSFITDWDPRLHECLVLLATSFSISTAYNLSETIRSYISNLRTAGLVIGAMSFMTRFADRKGEAERLGLEWPNPVDFSAGGLRFRSFPEEAGGEVSKPKDTSST